MQAKHRYGENILRGKWSNSKRYAFPGDGRPAKNLFRDRSSAMSPMQRECFASAEKLGSDQKGRRVMVMS